MSAAGRLPRTTLAWLCSFHDGHADGARSTEPDPVCDACGLPVLEDPHTPADLVFHSECCPDPECPENEQ